MKLTKEDIYAIRHADALVVQLNCGLMVGIKNGCVRLIKRKPTYGAKPFETDQEYILTNAPVRANSPDAVCSAHVSIYYDQMTPAASILRTLKVNDEISFEFYSDYHTTTNLAIAGMHADALLLHVRRNDKKHATFELSTVICPENSARMMKGVPYSDYYQEEIKKARNNS